MQITFGGAKDMAIFWGFVKMLLEAMSPWILISFAFVLAGLVIGIVIKLYQTASGNDDSDDDDYDFKHY